MKTVVRLKTGIPGNAAGDVCGLDPDFARQLVAAGMAELVAPPAAPAPVKEAPAGLDKMIGGETKKHRTKGR